MNSGKSDASTSTDDIKGRPLCLFYFTHPFGVLSPDPPTITTAPENVTQAFINMEPVSPYFWSSTTQEPYSTTSSSASKVNYEIGNVTIPKKPVNVTINTRNAPKCSIDLNFRRDTLSSSLLSSDLWMSSSSSRSCDYSRRIVPYNKTLPPLDMQPITRDYTESSDDFWPKKCYSREKFSLPPLDIPKKKKKSRRKVADPMQSAEKVREVTKNYIRTNKVYGVKKVRRRARLSGVRRTLTCLIQRAVKGRKDPRSSPAIQEVLNTIREAWTEPISLLERCHALNSSQTGESAREGDEHTQVNASKRDDSTMDSSAMLKRTQLAELPPRPGASPGLLRRRYSVPEIIMRKYRLAQQRSDSDDSGATTAPSRAASPASPSPPRGSCASLCEPPHRFLRRDRELMRKSALLRRLWAKPNCNPCPACCYCSGDLDTSQECGRETRSLDGSRSELRPLSSSFTSSRHSRESHMPAGWATPKRQRLESPNNLHASDEMLRTAMRNSYDRAEELRHEREELSDSTFQSHEHGASSYVVTSSETPFTDSQDNTSDSHGYKKVNKDCTYTTTAAASSCKTESLARSQEENTSMMYIENEEQSLTDTSESFPTTISIMKDAKGYADKQLSKSGHIDIRINEKFEEIDNNDDNVLSYENASITPSYEVLEIVVSETINTPSNNAHSISAIECSKKEQNTNSVIFNNKNMQNIDLDEYVSNILVESLNSLTDQIELMNASIGNERKINIVEKEIKVKLQNTGVNTIVHLSPTSNNQIIFGNEELYNKEDSKNDVHEVTIRDENYSVESNNNYMMSAATYREQSGQRNVEEMANDTCETIIQNETVNKAVLQQIQKLFQDGLENFDPQMNYSVDMIPEISHIEISNVDVFIDENGDANLETTCMTDLQNQNDMTYKNGESSFLQSRDTLSIGTGNYYKDMDDAVLVPRYLAFPNTDSMEVNTSSSDDAEIIGSDCTSLVDSLEDPNSPRTIFLRRASNNKRSELVRSAIDVLDLLPDSAFKTNEVQPREKSESFFVRIKDDNCDCEKENIVVADHMPDTIKQRLYRRHRKREIRMECARRKKVKQLKREIEKQRHNDMIKSKRDIEKECMTIINALIDEVITKIAEEEYKYMKIKQKPSNQLHKKYNENIGMSSSKRSSRKKDNDVEYLDNMESLKLSKNGSVHFRPEDLEKEKYRKSEKNRIRGKLSFKERPSITWEERGPKRIYQKSEIHDGNKCIEILEILEYVETSQSSPETTNSDDNHNANRNRKSKIPIPVYERIQKIPKHKPPKCHNSPTYGRNSPILGYEKEERSNRLLENMLMGALSDSTDGETSTTKKDKLARTPDPPIRRASVPQQEIRSRSNSLRFKQIFDIIPEEKSSLSIESSNEDMNYNRRVSAPNLAQNFTEPNNNETTKSRKSSIESPKSKRRDSLKNVKETKSAGTSPLIDISDTKSPQNTKNKNVMTSPIRKSAATSPIFRNETERNDKSCGPSSGSKKSLSSHGTKAGWLGFYKPNKQILDEEGLKDTSKESKSSEKSSSKEQKSISTQYEQSLHTQSTVRTIESEIVDQIIIGKDKSRSRKEPTQSRESKRKSDERKQKEKRKKGDKNKSESMEQLKEKAGKHNGLVRSLSDPQSRDVVIRKTDKKRIQMISLEKSEEETIHPRSIRLPNCLDDKNNRSSSDSEDSGKSLLCSLAPKWLSVSNRQKRQARKKPSQEQANPQNAAGGWSVTVAGNCHTALPADVEMRLRFPKGTAHNVTSQSDSGFGEESRSRAPIAAACQCRHCDDCTCTSKLKDQNYPPILPSGKMTVTMKKESSGSSILASKTSRKSTEALPDLETYKASKSKTKSSVKMRRECSPNCWLPGDAPHLYRTNKGLSVLGCAIVPETKPRVPTMSEKDLIRVYTPRHYLRS